MFFKLKSQSSSPTQVNEALDSFSELYHPRVAARLRQKINLCVQWANNVADVAEVKNCFRNIGSFSLSESHTFPVFKTRSDKMFENLTYQDWMSTLHDTRRKDLGEERLLGSNDFIDLAGGRLLVVEPWGTTWTGISCTETGAFFDINDLPPIGLWVEYISTPEIVSGTPKEHPPYFRDDGYILSYVPKSFLEVVQRGIDVNAEECIYWLEDQEHISGAIIKSWEYQDKS